MKDLFAGVVVVGFIMMVCVALNTWACINGEVMPLSWDNMVPVLFFALSVGALGSNIGRQLI